MMSLAVIGWTANEGCETPFCAIGCWAPQNAQNTSVATICFPQKPQNTACSENARFDGATLTPNVTLPVCRFCKCSLNASRISAADAKRASELYSTARIKICSI